MQDILSLLQHHASLSMTLTILLILLTIVEFIRSKKGAQQLSPALATQMINHQNATVLDVRKADVFSTGHIVDAVSIPLDELQNKYKKLDKSKPIIIVCATSTESQQAVNLLAKYEFKAFILAGGIRGWKDAGMPLVKE